MIGCRTIAAFPADGCGSGKELRMAVRKRGAKWHYDITVNGVRYRGAIKTARTKSQAQQAEAKIRLQIHQGEYGKPPGLKTLKEFVEQSYLPWAKANKRSWRIDTSRLKPILDFFGKKRLCEINPFLIERYKIKRRGEPIFYHNSTKARSVASVNRELRLLSRIFRLAVTNREVFENPCRQVGILKGEQGRTRYLLPDEEERLMSVLTEDRAHLKDMVILAINTGLRVSELLKLQIEDVDFHRDVVYVKKTKTDEDREVPMNNTTRALMAELIKHARERGNQYLFTNAETGTRYTTIKTAWKTACKLAGITDLRFHDLRHTFGTRAADDGVALSAIRDVLGHKSIQTTERYAHATDKGKRQAVEALEKKPKKSVTIRSQKGERRSA